MTSPTAFTAPGQVLLFGLGFLVGARSTRWDPRIPWVTGVTINALGLVSYAFFHADETQVMISTLVFGLGGGLAVASVPLLILGSTSPREQGMATGLSVLMTGLVNAVTAQIVFVVLADSGVVMKGTQFYSDTSFRNAYLVAAVLVGIGAVASLSLPRILRTSEIQSGGGASTA